MNEQVLKENGLSLAILDELSFESQLGISLKKNLHYFEKEPLLEELIYMSKWLDKQDILDDISLDYRIKSRDSILLKYNRYYPDHQARKVFNDILGFRAFCTSYDEILKFDPKQFRIADMSMGKAEDDGYRQLNNWLHEYLYKKDYQIEVGQILRQKYEMGFIKNENQFKEVLNNVLFNS